MAEMPRLQAAIPPTIKIDVAVDRTTTIRSSVRDVEISLLISVCLVVFVVFLFLREVWATIIPSIAVPLSLVGTFGVMCLLGYTIDNLSLMALTIATGFVVFFKHVIVGLILGVPLAIGAGRLLSAELYGVSSWDPFALTVAAGALSICAFFAALVPASRAASISPMDALRIE